MSAPQEEHREIIKSHHANLRKRMRDGESAAEVWQANLDNNEPLLKYATAMQALGDSWKAKAGTTAAQPQNPQAERIHWILETIRNYFTTAPASQPTPTEEPPAKRLKTDTTMLVPSGLIRPYLKTQKREHFETHGHMMDTDAEQQLIASLSAQHDLESGRKVEVLDVGSCYNPIGEHQNGNVNITAVDLQPAPGSDVLQCDFSSVPFETSERLWQGANGVVKSLRIGGFDAVVFCFLLSYMPCPRIRFACVANAFTALRPNGVLVIVVPRTIGKRNDLSWIKQWTAVLASLCFERVAQEIKAKIVCLAFRKASDAAMPPEVPEHLAQIPILADSV